ncbi:hypothetical protein [Robbsia sp. KACC 23696]|uniref:hypothetical protein n=1 Tax=Robbsia sp. KACC 23696 TaxID=3149231 RepID=UPI00325A801F
MVREIPIPIDQQRHFDAHCHDDGLHPDGFDVHAYGEEGQADSLEMAVRINKTEYKYATPPHEYGWIARFFADLNRDTRKWDG